jgi:hypothetical protein
MNMYVIFVFLFFPSQVIDARIFKSIDSEKAFEAEFVQLERGIMKCITKTGKEVNVAIEKLTERDQVWIKTASIVIARSKKTASFRVLHVDNDGSVLVRLNLDAQRQSKYDDPYTGEFILIDCSSGGAKDFGVTETRVCDLYWSGTKTISTETWRNWYYFYYRSYPIVGKEIVLGSYCTSLEPAVDEYVKNNLDQRDD